MPYLNARIEGVYSTDQGFSVILEVEDTEEILPVFISKTQALSIKAGISEAPINRPLTHDLILRILEDMDLEVESVSIDDLMNGTFLAELRLVRGERIFPYDVRPSDGIALAVREQAKILVESEVMNEAGMSKEELADSGFEI